MRPAPKGYRLNYAPDQKERHPIAAPARLHSPSQWQLFPDFVQPTSERIPCTTHTGSDTARLLSLMAGRRRIGQGESLYHEHDHFNFIYAVQSGSFKSTLALADGLEQVSSFHMVGELLGLDGVADGRHASRAVALEDSEISTLSYAHLTDLSSALSGVHHILMRLISREIVRSHCHMVVLGSLNSTQRLAAFLLNQSERLSARGYSALEFHLKMTRGEIGSFLGLTLETVSRAFTELQEQRLVQVKRRHIVIANLDGLSRV